MATSVYADTRNTRRDLQSSKRVCDLVQSICDNIDSTIYPIVLVQRHKRHHHRVRENAFVVYDQNTLWPTFTEKEDFIPNHLPSQKNFFSLKCFIIKLW